MLVSLEIWHLLATILMILLRVNWPNFVQFPTRLDVLGTGLYNNDARRFALVRKHYYSNLYVNSPSRAPPPLPLLSPPLSL